MSQANAIVVLCPKRPDLAGQPLLGHVGWGFELPDGQWMVGAVEGDGWSNGNGMNGFWSRRVPGERQATQVFANMVHQGAEYNYFKYLTMTHQVWPDPDAAVRVMAWVSAQPYQLFGRNCMNSTYDVLRAFSRGGHFNGKILPNPDFNWIPNGWFNAIQVPQSDYHHLPPASQPVQAFAAAREELQAAAECPDWRNPESENYLPVGEAPNEAVEAVEVPPPVNAAGVGG